MKRCGNCFQEYNTQQDICPYCGYFKGQPPSELYHLFPETVLADRYIVGQVLGFGGFGITYKAWDIKLDTVVAIKEYYPSGLVNRISGEKEVILFAANKEKEYQYGRTRFLDEARNMAKFSSHKNIVNVFTYFEENNTAYIVMEFLDGISLGGYLKENTLDVDSCLDLILNVSSALKELHSSGIIHRDVSPDNIFLCLNGNIKLIDFGAARFSNNEENQLTIILKPGFAPPEQYEKISSQGPWTDIYALGATLYLMLTGKKPEESTNRKVKDTLIAPNELNQQISENISNTVMKAMSIEKNLRFTKIEEFEKALNGEKKITTLLKEKKRRKRKRILGILSTTLVILLTSGILISRFLKQKEAETLPDADIELWYELSGYSDLDNAKTKALSEIVEKFMSSYPNVTIELQGVKQTEYLNLLNIAMEDQVDGKILAVFESSDINSDQLQNLAGDVSGISALENIKKCYFLEDYSDKNQIPMGFSVPMIYCNKAVTSFSDASVSDIQILLNNIGKSNGIAIHTKVKDSIVEAFGKDIFDNKEVKLVENMDGFVAGEYAFYISSSEEYMGIQSKLPARYSIVSIETDGANIEFSDFYSMNGTLSEDETKVALAILNFMLSDNAQDYLYVQNYTGYLPLNRGALQTVEEVYDELNGFFDNISEYSSK